jgi:hypothetical protein
MTHHPQANETPADFPSEVWPDEAPTSWGDLIELLSEHGFGGMARAMQLFFNEAMKVTLQPSEVLVGSGGSWPVVAS